MRVVMRHPDGTVFRHTGGIIRALFDWRWWLLNYRHGYRFSIEKSD